MDVLSDILDILQLRGTLYFRTAFSSPWSVAVPAFARAARFHLAVQGQCHVRVGDDTTVVLDPGDMVMIPNGAAHVLSDQTGRPPLALDSVLEQAGYTGDGLLVYGGSPDHEADAAANPQVCKMICGHLNFAEGADHPLLRALPATLLVTAELRAQQTWLDELMRLITRQMFAAQPAGDGPVTQPGVTASVIRLTEALFIEVVRSCADQDPALRSILEAMGDPRIGQALSLMHRGPEQIWTLDGIAREVGMSRSRFADRFQQLIGAAPMSYLADIRLQKAMNLLSDGREPIQRVAASVGYQSPAAFSRAFTNRYGQSPSEVRRAPA